MFPRLLSCTYENKTKDNHLRSGYRSVLPLYCIADRPYWVFWVIILRILALSLEQAEEDCNACGRLLPNSYTAAPSGHVDAGASHDPPMQWYWKWSNSDLPLPSARKVRLLCSVSLLRFLVLRAARLILEICRIRLHSGTFPENCDCAESQSAHHRPTSINCVSFGSGLWASQHHLGVSSGLRHLNGMLGRLTISSPFQLSHQ